MSVDNFHASDWCELRLCSSSQKWYFNKNYVDEETLEKLLRLRFLFFSLPQFWDCVDYLLAYIANLTIHWALCLSPLKHTKHTPNIMTIRRLWIFFVFFFLLLSLYSPRVLSLSICLCIGVLAVYCATRWLVLKLKFYLLLHKIQTLFHSLLLTLFFFFQSVFYSTSLSSSWWCVFVFFLLFFFGCLIFYIFFAQQRHICECKSVCLYSSSFIRWWCGSM